MYYVWGTGGRRTGGFCLLYCEVGRKKKRKWPKGCLKSKPLLLNQQSLIIFRTKPLAQVNHQNEIRNAHPHPIPLIRVGAPCKNSAPSKETQVF